MQDQLPGRHQLATTLEGTNGMVRSPFSNDAYGLDHDLHAYSNVFVHGPADAVPRKWYLPGDANDLIPVQSAAPSHHNWVGPHVDDAYRHHLVGAARPASATCASTTSTRHPWSSATSTALSVSSATWEGRPASPRHRPTTAVILPAATTRSRGGGFSPTAATHLHAMQDQL